MRSYKHRNCSLRVASAAGCLLALAVCVDAYAAPEVIRDHDGVVTTAFVTILGDNEEELAELSKYPGLQHVYVKFKKRTPNAFHHLARIRNLRTLDISDVRGVSQERTVPEDALATVTGLKGLRKLSIQNVDWSKSDLRNLAKLDGLRELSFSNCTLGDEGGANLAKLSHLEVLQFENTPLSAKFVRELAPLTDLMVLSFSRCKVTDESLEWLRNLGHLYYLDLSDNPVGNKSVERLQRLPSLVKLSLASTQVTDDGVKRLSAFPSLRMLKLGGLDISDEGIAHLVELKNLDGLDLYTAVLMTDKSLEKLGQMRHLRSLRVSRRETSKEARERLKESLPDAYKELLW